MSRAIFAFSHVPLCGEMAQFYRYLCVIEEHDLMFQLSVTGDATQFDINNLFFFSFSGKSRHGPLTSQ